MAEPEPILVVTLNLDSALALSETISDEGFEPILVPSTDLDLVEGIEPSPAAVLILREVPACEKVRACRFLKASPKYAPLPVVAVLTVDDAGTDIPADVLIPPPGSLLRALDEIGRLIRERER